MIFYPKCNIRLSCWKSKKCPLTTTTNKPLLTTESFWKGRGPCMRLIFHMSAYLRIRNWGIDIPPNLTPPNISYWALLLGEGGKNVVKLLDLLNKSIGFNPQLNMHKPIFEGWGTQILFQSSKYFQAGHFQLKSCIILLKYILLFSLVQVQNQSFGPKQNTKFTVNHHHPPTTTEKFLQGSRHSKRLKLNT